MNKSNKYSIYYVFYKNKSHCWRISIKKLKINCYYSKKNNHFISFFSNRKKLNTLHNFIIEPNLIIMIKSNDKLSQNVAFEILNNRLNDRTI